MEENAEDFKTCHVCMEDMTQKQPRMLPCVHSFCTSCLKVLHKGSKKKNVIPCPLCRKTVKVASVELIPLNIYLNDSSEVSKSVDKRVGKCCICTEPKTSVVRCLDCFKELCNDCRKAHLEIPAFQNHRLRNNGSNICVDHLEAINCVCNECNAELCNKCAYDLKHATHRGSIFNLEDSCVTQKKEIEEKVMEVQHFLKKKLSSLEESKKTISSMEQSIKIHKDKLVADINKVADDLLENLNHDKEKIATLTEKVRKSFDKVERAKAVCAKDCSDYDHYTVLASLNVAVEVDIEESRKSCLLPVSTPYFYPQKPETVTFGMVKYTKENLESFPEPKYDSRLNRISMCTDTIYELFLSQSRTQKADYAIENFYENLPHTTQAKSASAPTLTQEQSQSGPVLRRKNETTKSEHRGERVFEPEEGNIAGSAAEVDHYMYMSVHMDESHSKEDQKKSPAPKTKPKPSKSPHVGSTKTI